MKVEVSFVYFFVSHHHIVLSNTEVRGYSKSMFVWILQIFDPLFALKQ